MKMIKIHKENSHALTAHLELHESKSHKTMTKSQVSLLISKKIWLQTKKTIIFLSIIIALILTFYKYKKILNFTVFKKNLKSIFNLVIIACHHKRDKSLKIISIVTMEYLKVGLKLSRNQREILNHKILKTILMTTNNNKENSNSQLM